VGDNPLDVGDGSGWVGSDQEDIGDQPDEDSAEATCLDYRNGMRDDIVRVVSVSRTRKPKQRPETALRTSGATGHAPAVDGALLPIK
jgi:hypothetical protein